MKKTLIAVAAAAALTTSAFAEITFGAWGRTILVPVASTGDATVAGQSQSWGGYGRAIGLDIMGQDAEGKAGFKMAYRNTTNAEAQTGDDAHFWIKPIDTVKVYAGKVEYNGLRGNACLPGWDVMRCSFEVGEDLLFKNYANTGALVVANPNDALTVFVGVPLTADFLKGKAEKKAELKENGTGSAKVPADPTADNSDDDQASNVYKRTQAGIGYNIDGVGIVKAQFIGKNKKNNNEKYTGDVEASFELNAVENLWVGVGVTHSIIDKKYNGSITDFSKAVGVDTKIGLGASYKVSDELTVKANSKVLIATNYDKTTATAGESIKPGMQFAAGVDYKIQDGLNFVGQVGYLAERKCGDTKINESSVSAMGGVNYACGAANVFAGFQMQTNVAGGAEGLKMTNTSNDKKTQWAIPVVITMGF